MMRHRPRRAGPGARSLLGPATVALLLAAPGAGHAGAGRLITIEQAYALALRNNPTLELMAEAVRQAEAERYKAWAALKPTAAMQTTLNVYDEEIAFDFPGMGSVTLQKKTQFGMNLVATVPLFVGPAYPAIGLARKTVELKQLDQARSRQALMLQVAGAYYAVVSQKEVVTALQHKVQVDEKNLAAARARFDVGSDPRSTVMRADLVLTQDQQKLRSATDGLAAARRILAIYLRTPGPLEVQQPAEPPSPLAAHDALYGAALRDRADYQAAALGVELARKGKEVTWWGFLPSLTASWMYRWSEATNFVGDHDTWYFLFNLNLPLYDGGLRYADLRSADAGVRLAALQRKALAEGIETELVQLASSLESAEAGVVSARKALGLARATAEDMEASYAAGQTTQLDVLDAGQRLLDAELALTSSLYSRDLARLSLRHALGSFDPLKR